MTNDLCHGDLPQRLFQHVQVLFHNAQISSALGHISRRGGLEGVEGQYLFLRHLGVLNDRFGDLVTAPFDGEDGRGL